MNVEIGTEAALLPEMEYIKGIFVAVYLFVVKLGMKILQRSRDHIRVYQGLTLI
jgi:hypothetical protein